MTTDNPQKFMVAPYWILWTTDGKTIHKSPKLDKIIQSFKDDGFEEVFYQLTESITRPGLMF